ncbi:MAG: hypothetical protein AW07_01499 [Candidatus Accumulibacter sp. SK-11]|nr:MAG: hypothetical protein AW07_01499 [Candidatus Accumulibacter sp. SK-11]
MRCGLRISARFMRQISGHSHGFLRNLPEIPQSVSPGTTMCRSGAPLASSRSWAAALETAASVARRKANRKRIIVLSSYV